MVGGDNISLQGDAGSSYPYFEIRNGSGVRAFYLGWGIQGSRVDFVLENGDNLSIRGGNAGIGVASPTQRLHVQGNMRLTGALYDSNNQPGSAGEVLVSTGTAISLATGIFYRDFYFRKRK